jgi:hypothetical protein
MRVPFVAHRAKWRPACPHGFGNLLIALRTTGPVVPTFLQSLSAYSGADSGATCIRLPLGIEA